MKLSKLYRRNNKVSKDNWPVYLNTKDQSIVINRNESFNSEDYSLQIETLDTNDAYLLTLKIAVYSVLIPQHV